MASNKVTLAFVLTLTYFVRNVVIGIRTVSTAHDIENFSFLINEENPPTNPGQVYGVCDERDRKVSERHCSVILETDKSLGNPDHLRFCNLTFSSHTKDNKVGRNIDMTALNEDTAIVRWKDLRQHLRFGIVRFSDCKVVTAKIDDDVKLQYFVAFIPNGQTFDLVAQNLGSEGPCIGNEYCKLTFDMDGNIIKSTHFSINGSTRVADMVRSPTKGYLAVDTTKTEARIYASNHKDSMEIIKTYPVKPPVPSANGVVMTSRTYQHWSICSRDNLKINCQQLDLNGEVKFEVSVQISKFTRLHSFRVHNLPGGGFLLLYAECLKTNTHDCLSSETHYFVTKFDSSGQRVGSLEITEPDCKSGFTIKRLRFFPYEDKEMCLSFACDLVKEKNQVRLDVNCFKNEELIA